MPKLQRNKPFCNNELSISIQFRELHIGGNKMDNINCYHSILALIYRNIEYYKYMITLCSTPCQRIFYESQLYNERMYLNYWKSYYYYKMNNQRSQLNQRTHLGQRNLPENEYLLLRN